MSHHFSVAFKFIKNMHYFWMITFADLIHVRDRSPRLPFTHASRFSASFGSSWCCLKSLRTLSIHLSLGLPRGIFPPTFIVVTCFAEFMSSLLVAWPYHERRFWTTYVLFDLSCAFDTINDKIILRRLEHSVGISGAALECKRTVPPSGSEQC